MTRFLLLLGSTFLLLILIVSAALWVLARQSRTIDPPRLSGRKLSDHSENPNYVSSLVESSEGFIEPLSFTVDPTEAWKAAVGTVQTIPNAEIVTEENGYLHAECRTSFFGFVDDLELQLNSEEKMIHVRSESRVGHSDLGANRKRVEKLRANLFKALEK